MELEIIKIEDIFELKNSESFLPILQDYSKDFNKTESELQNSKKLLIFLENLSSFKFERKLINYINRSWVF